jgi:chromosome segregation ATPase
MVARRSPMALAVLITLTAVAASGCDSWYYKTMKKFGVEKRDILVKRVKDARESQQEAKDEFKTALERFKAVIDVDGGTLEDKYDKLNKELNRSEDRAKKVRDRIDSVRSVSDDLFKEWGDELKQYADRSLRAESDRELKATRRRCETLIRSMERAQKRIEPVLTPLRDRVLFLKHNLNAQAIGALDAELLTVRTSVAALITDLEAAIAEADQFVESLSNAENLKHTSNTPTGLCAFCGSDSRS